ncbi:MAG: MerR family transcriptional regulator [Gammaproteobacteria bacterium]|nr:MerR family transcriptional regulator [Gammaproteobacteria bacterium]
MSKHSIHIEIIDEYFEFSLADLCQCCGVQAEAIIDMVEEGLLTPVGTSPSNWRFTGTAQRKVEITLHLQRDLRINLPGAALALELMEEIDMLRSKLQIKG